MPEAPRLSEIRAAKRITPAAHCIQTIARRLRRRPHCIQMKDSLSGANGSVQAVLLSYINHTVMSRQVRPAA